MSVYNLRGISPASLIAGGTILKDRLVIMDSTANQCVQSTATTDNHLGVALAAAASGAVVPIQQRGRGRLVASAAITVGDKLMFATGGKVATLTSTNTCVGIAMTAAAADLDVIEAELTMPTATF